MCIYAIYILGIFVRPVLMRVRVCVCILLFLHSEAKMIYYKQMI